MNLSVNDLALGAFVSPTVELIGAIFIITTWVYAADLSSISQLAWSFMFLPTFFSVPVGYLNVYVLRRWNEAQNARPLPVVSILHGILEGLTLLLAALGMAFLFLQGSPAVQPDKRFWELFVATSVFVVGGSLGGIVVVLLLLLASRRKDK